MSLVNFFILRLLRCLKQKKYTLEACLLLLPIILLLAAVKLPLKEYS